MLLEIHVPDLTKSQLAEDPINPELLTESLPVTIFESITFELHNEHVDLLEALNELLDVLVAGVLPQPCREILQLAKQAVNLLSELPGLDTEPGFLLHLVNLLPDPGELTPHPLQVLQLLPADSHPVLAG